MLKKFRDNMLYIGMIIFSLTLVAEYLFLGGTNLTDFPLGFFKGFATGIMLIGIIILIKNRHFNIKESN